MKVLPKFVESQVELSPTCGGKSQKKGGGNAKPTTAYTRKFGQPSQVEKKGRDTNVNRPLVKPKKSETRLAEAEIWLKNRIKNQLQTKPANSKTQIKCEIGLAQESKPKEKQIAKQDHKSTCDCNKTKKQRSNENKKKTSNDKIYVTNTLRTRLATAASQNKWKNVQIKYVQIVEKCQKSTGVCCGRDIEKSREIEQKEYKEKTDNSSIWTHEIVDLSGVLDRNWDKLDCRKRQNSNRLVVKIHCVRIPEMVNFKICCEWNKTCPDSSKN